ncbi:MAG: ABC transporter ATP-binding protein [Pseudomonadota bacterium]|nr:ABC transporter ATP-binding protein [Pseudomonadota bacterium]
MSAPLLEVVGLCKGFAIRGGLWGGVTGEVKAVQDVSFAIAKGEVFGLAGESGSGKSTIARMILGLSAPSAGAIKFEGRDLSARANAAARGAVQMVFQNPGSSLNPRRSIGQSIAVPLEASGASRGEVGRRVAQLLDMVQLPADFRNRYPYELSGGQKQRVAIARALALEPKLIVLDEPTSALDVSVQAKIIELLMELGRTLGLTYIFISHDLSLMRNFATRIGILYLGRLVESGATRSLFETPAHPYTQSLLAAIPVISDAETALKPQVAVVEGEIPSPANQPPGCAFHPRCPHAFAPCKQVMPDFTELGAGHLARCHLLSAPAP